MELQYTSNMNFKNFFPQIYWIDLQLQFLF